MTVHITVNGAQLAAPRGSVLAAVLIAADRWAFRQHPLTGAPRGPLCGMGVCLECEVTVDGRPGTRACLTQVSDGMQVQTVGGGVTP